MPMPGMPGAGQGGMPMQGMMSGGMGRMMGTMRPQAGMYPMMRMLQHMDGVLAFYRTELHITEAQQPQWNAFAGALQAAAARMRQSLADGGMPGSAAGTAPELMQQRIDLLSAHLDVLRTVQAAWKPLYAAFSDEQKRTADELLADHFRSMCGMMP